ncbi:sigma-54-dependent Fis family transcriptional regulator [Aquincola sp. S2]|uniref:Sigma-54-dependent Fis family transcriptional regulator n=1 Tax=Pseudaquabacterium terrae TaxID=2732868 RepID=A0ABX2EGR3_9BURK|nr:sigma-54-dependent Fis family transcriptional regulator [Aquabacterium terrae]
MSDEKNQTSCRPAGPAQAGAARCGNAFKIVFVEDDASVRESLTETLELAGFQVCAVESAERALRQIDGDFKGIVITDVRLPGMDGLALMRKLTHTDPDLPVVLITGHGDVPMAVQAMREGAYDFIEKPFPPQRLIESARRAIEKRALRIEVDALRQQLADQRGVESVLIGNSPAIRTVRRQILAVADSGADILVVGETGTGKELVARCLHDHSRRSHANFVAINCGGIPETLFESEIFGHEAGAFTGAAKRRVGKIEHASGGTLFLDEIESMPLTYQVKLLRTLQDRKVERLGSNDAVKVDFRVVAAAKTDLRQLSDQGKFRSDLYYRLSVALVHLPPLRERKEDIPLLFENFVLQAALRYGRDAPAIPQDQLRQLMAHDWPGNVRELRNAADRLVLGLLRSVDDAPLASDEAPQALALQMDMIEKALLEQALRQFDGRPKQVYEALDIAKKTFYDKVRKHAIDLSQFRCRQGADADPEEG